MNFKNLNVLVVDDEEGIVDYLKKYIVHKGYKVTGVYDGEVAINEFKKSKYDIVVLDIHLKFSTINGLTTLFKIRKIRKDCPCIFMTRNKTQIEMIDKAESLGNVRFSKKPDCTGSRILNLIKKILSER